MLFNRTDRDLYQRLLNNSFVESERSKIMLQKNTFRSNTVSMQVDMKQTEKQDLQELFSSLIDERFGCAIDCHP